ncbi:MAG: hypothetical protein ABIA75_14705 [Candidatus Neomarinimicrobiota bacterium]
MKKINRISIILLAVAIFNCDQPTEDLLTDGDYQVVFSSKREGGWGGWDIYALNLSGIGLQRLTEENGDDIVYTGGLSVGTQKIVFSSTRDNSRYQIYIMDSDGSNQTLLSTDPNVDDNYPRFTPDGLRIVFASNREGRYDIFSMDVAGNNLVNLTASPAYHEKNPMVSPDGTKILFTRSILDTIRHKNMYLDQPYLMNIDGSNLVDLGRAEYFGPAIRFAPNMEYIIFHGGLIGYRNTDIYRVDLATLEITQLSNSSFSEYATDISPDSRKIAYHRADEYGGHMVYIIDADGSNRKILTYGLDSRDAYFTPKGDKLIYSTNIEGPYNIYKMDIDGSAPERISNHRAEADYRVVGNFIGVQ